LLSQVATSVVYTPSECMKQRMQVQAHASTWSALKAILKADGPAGLYRGWTAVLARNIPQSAIKFFTFEQLKWLLLSSGGAAAAVGELRCARVRGSRTVVDCMAARPPRTCYAARTVARQGVPCTRTVRHLRKHHRLGLILLHAPEQRLRRHRRSLRHREMNRRTKLYPAPRARSGRERSGVHARITSPLSYNG
jgi:hypothetical protein